MIIKKCYVKYRYSKYEVIEIKIYSTNKILEVATRFGGIPYCGWNDEVFINNEYIKKEDTLKWKTKDWNTYISKTTKYLIKLIEFARDCAEFDSGYYGNIFLDYKTFFTDILDKECQKGSFLDDVCGTYCVAAFAARPFYYSNITESLSNLKLIKSIVEKQISFYFKYVRREWEDDLFRQRFKRKLTEEERNFCEKYLI